jgi:ABC-type dipeptide/oligopeptide/nickel transport system permease subunit
VSGAPLSLRIAASSLRSPGARRSEVVVGWAVLGAVAFAAVLGPLTGYPIGADADPSAASLGPSAAHWLGTDHLGRDVAWRLALACEAFAGPGSLAAITTAVVAVPLGAIAGWNGGIAAALVRWAMGVVASIPPLVLVLVACAIYGSSPLVLALTAGMAGAPALAETVAARIEAERRVESVLASRAHGLSDGRILALHLIVGSAGLAIARALLLGFGAFLALETTLSYLGGFGVREPLPSWGNMLAFEWGRAWLPAVAPGIAIWLTLGAVHAAADGFAEPSSG